MYPFYIHLPRITILTALMISDDLICPYSLCHAKADEGGPA